MAHCIQTIITATANAERIQQKFPQLSRVDTSAGMTFFPVDGDLIDSMTGSRPPQCTGEEFMLLTDGFHDFLRDLSLIGDLAYVETEYFGSWGGQGALVCQNGRTTMEPEWATASTINAALRLLGVHGGKGGDGFGLVGLGLVRHNEDLFDRLRDIDIATEDDS